MGPRQYFVRQGQRAGQARAGLAGGIGSASAACRESAVAAPIGIQDSRSDLGAAEPRLRCGAPIAEAVALVFQGGNLGYSSAVAGLFRWGRWTGAGKTGHAACLGVSPVYLDIHQRAC